MVHPSALFFHHTLALLGSNGMGSCHRVIVHFLSLAAQKLFGMNMEASNILFGTYCLAPTWAHAAEV